MRSRIVIRPRWATLTLFLSGALGILAVVVVLVADGPVPALRSAGVPAAAVFFCVWVWSWPELAIDNDGVTVRNTLKTTFIPWSAYRDTQVRLGLRIAFSHDGTERRVYAGAVPSRARLKPAKPPTIDVSKDGEVTISAEAPEAAEVLQQSFAAADGNRGAFRSHWNFVPMAIQIGLVVWAWSAFAVN